MRSHRERTLFLVTTLMFVLLAVTGSFAAIPVIMDGPEAGINAIPVIMDGPEAGINAIPVIFDESPDFTDDVADVVEEPPVTTYAIPVIMD